MSAKTYASAIAHENGYIARFQLPGQKPEFVAGPDGLMVFPSAELAELNGWRHVGARLNGARTAQIFVPRQAAKPRANVSELDRVFAAFKPAPDS